MPIPFKAAIDLEKNELQNARVQNLSSDPGTPVEGQFYYNTTTKTIGFRTNTTWIYLGRLDQISAPTADVSMASQKLTNLALCVAGTDAANKNYVDSVAQGLDMKASVRAATTAAGTLATSFANGQTIDGVTLVTGDRILIKNQAAPAENGIYTVNAGGAPTRATDMDAWTEVPGAFTFVEEGTTLADTGWACSANAGGTLNVTAITFVQFSSAGVVTASGGLTKTGNDIAMTAMAALSLKGNATNGAAAPTDIAAGSDHQVMRRSGTAIAFGALNLAQAAAVTGQLIAACFPALTGDVTTAGGALATTIANDAVTNAKAANMATATIKGRVTAGTGDPEDLTAAQARSVIAAPTFYRANVAATTAGVIAVTHSLGTRDVQVQVYRVVAPYETIYCDCERTDTNTVTLRFGADYAADTFRIVVVAVGV